VFPGDMSWWWQLLIALLVVVIVLAGPAMIFFGTRGFWTNQTFVTSSVTARATVVERVKRTYQSPYGGVDWIVPVLRFTARSGQVVTFVPHGTGSGDHPPDIPVGRTVQVLYDPRDPQKRGWTAGPTGGLSPFSTSASPCSAQSCPP
jgi:hypothetical protein